MRARLATWFCRGVSRLANSVDTRFSPLPGEPKTLYFTFDDGPHPEGTPRLLDVLAKHEIPATCFLVGENAQKWPGLVRRITAAGHSIGNHSHTHPDGWNSSWRHLLADFHRSDRVLEDLTGRPICRLRPPYGKLTRPLLRWANRRGQRVTLWDAMPPDFDARATPERLERAMLRARNGAIVCLHDNDVSQHATPRLLDDCLPRMKAIGWRFAALPLMCAGGAPPRQKTRRAQLATVVRKRIESKRAFANVVRRQPCGGGAPPAREIIAESDLWPV